MFTSNDYTCVADFDSDEVEDAREKMWRHASKMKILVWHIPDNVRVWRG